MKKIIIILFLFCLFYACYYIYNITEKKCTNIVLIGDSIANNPYLSNIGIVNKDFVNNDYHIADIVNILKYNQELDINNKSESIHKLLKQSNIVIISIGMNDIYYKLNNDSKEIYTYLNDMIDSYEDILKVISYYDYDEVYILGYYNITNEKNDIFNYINYKLRKIVDKYDYKYIDLNKILYNNDIFYKKNDNFCLNNSGYNEIYELIVENLKKY